MNIMKKNLNTGSVEPNIVALLVFLGITCYLRTASILYIFTMELYTICFILTPIRRIILNDEGKCPHGLILTNLHKTVTVKLQSNFQIMIEVNGHFFLSFTLNHYINIQI